MLRDTVETEFVVGSFFSNWMCTAKTLCEAEEKVILSLEEVPCF